MARQWIRSAGQGDRDCGRQAPRLSGAGGGAEAWRRPSAPLIPSCRLRCASVCRAGGRQADLGAPTPIMAWKDHAPRRNIPVTTAADVTQRTRGPLP
jgi:hypothetical protein